MIRPNCNFNALTYVRQCIIFLHMKSENKYKETHVRVKIGDRYHWVPREKCVRVLRKDGNGWRWKLLEDLPDPVGLR